MKIKYLFVSIILFSSYATFAQDIDSKDTSVYRVLQQKAAPGYDWIKYISNNLQYTQAARDITVSGRIVVEFIVEEDGSLSNARIIRGKELGHGLPEEALRLVNTAPKWQLGKQNRQNVRSYFTLSIIFTLPENENAVGLMPTSDILNVTDVDKNPSEDNLIYRNVETVASSNYNFNDYLNNHLLYPEDARKNKVQGRVHVEFIVEKDGNISDAKITRGKEIGNGIPEEALRVVKAMPKWTPAKMKGKSVRSYFVIPVTFKLQ